MIKKHARKKKRNNIHAKMYVRKKEEEKIAHVF
jgi:hypothetical protein